MNKSRFGASGRLNQFEDYKLSELGRQPPGNILSFGLMKWLHKILLVIPIALVLLFIAFFWFFTEAFGPTHRTIEIKLDEENTLTGYETYNADMHDVHYVVDFVVKGKDSDSVMLGTVDFADDQWPKNVQTMTLGEWYLFTMPHYSSLTLAGVNKRNRANFYRSLSANDLMNDTIWTLAYPEIPYINEGSTKIDSIVGNRFYTGYSVSDERVKPHTVEYEMDTITGMISTRKVLVM